MPPTSRDAGHEDAGDVPAVVSCMDVVPGLRAHRAPSSRRQSSGVPRPPPPLGRLQPNGPLADPEHGDARLAVAPRHERSGEREVTRRPATSIVWTARDDGEVTAVRARPPAAGRDGRRRTGRPLALADSRSRPESDAPSRARRTAQLGRVDRVGEAADRPDSGLGMSDRPQASRTPPPSRPISLQPTRSWDRRTDTDGATTMAGTSTGPGAGPRPRQVEPCDVEQRHEALATG